MGKEAKLGVALIALLLSVFGFMLYQRMKSAHEATQAAAAAAAELEKPETPPEEKPKLSSGPRKPAAVQSASPEPPAAAESGEPNPSRSPAASGNNRYSDRYSDRYATSAQQIYGPSDQ